MNIKNESHIIQSNLANHDQMVIAKESSQLLAKHLNNHQDTVVVVTLEGNEEKSVLKIPTRALELLQNILTHVANGQEITLMPQHTELSTQQAADILNVSRPFFVGLLERNELPYHKVGTHRRVYLEDVLTYKANINTKRQQVLKELAEQAQELNMGY